MASSVAAFSISAASCPGSLQRGKAVSGFHRRTSVSYPSCRRSNSSRLRILCAAKPETVDKVCAIVKKQLALGDDQALSGESKFSALGADSLDTVEIVMGLEEVFGISVEEESAQNISTVQDAADLIEKLCSQQE